LLVELYVFLDYGGVHSDKNKPTQRPAWKGMSSHRHQ